MRVEAECLSSETINSKKVLKSYSVPLANWVGIDFLGDETKIAVFCSIDNKKGSVLIKDPKKIIEVVRFENPDDQEGEKMDPDSRIEIFGEQQLSIYTIEGKYVKEVFVFLSFENNQNQEINLQSDSDEVSIEPPIIAS